MEGEPELDIFCEWPASLDKFQVIANYMRDTSASSLRDRLERGEKIASPTGSLFWLSDIEKEKWNELDHRK